MSMVKLVNVRKSFGDLEVLKGVNLEVQQGEVVCIIGASGSGKSTMLRCLNQLERISDGEIYIEDVLTDKRAKNKDLMKIDPATVQSLCTELGMVFQNFNLFPHLTVIDNVTIAPLIVKKADKKIAETRALDLLSSVGLAEKKDEYPSRLSGGQQQRVAIARALSASPELLLLDEPTGNLDWKTARQTVEFIKETIADLALTILLVTHSQEVASLFPRTLLLRNGALEALPGGGQEGQG